MSITFMPAPLHDAETDKYTFFEDAPQMNVSNSNGAMLLRNLGIEVDYAGHISPTDLMVAVKTSDPVILGGTPDVVTRGALGATMIDCGVGDTYVADRFMDLIEIAKYAAEKGVNVQWC